MPTTTEARDEILGLFKAAWDANTPAINGGSVVEVRWQGVDAGTPPAADEPFARITIKHGPSGQTTFGAVGARRFTRFGIVTVQIFDPVSKGGGLVFLDQASNIAKNAFEGVGTASGIWFRDVTIKEIDHSNKYGPWQQFNVLADFQYDEVR